MASVRCLRDDCKYNRNGWCDNDYIRITWGKECDEYREKEEENEDER